MASSKYIKEVEESLSRLSTNDLAASEKLRGYIGTQLRVWGLSTPEQKALCKKGFSFYTADHESVFRTFDSIYRHGQTLEAKNQALFYLDLNYKRISPEVQLELLPNWVSYVDNWAHSDYLSKFLTRLLEEETTAAAMTQQIQTWNKAINPWERRQSLVALYYYARTKKNQIPYETGEHLIKPLLGDTHYFVQKGLGWTLRESYNVYPAQTFLFIERYYHKVSATAFTAAIEKMTPEEKLHLKHLRRNHA